VHLDLGETPGSGTAMAEDPGKSFLTIELNNCSMEASQEESGTHVKVKLGTETRKRIHWSVHDLER
jgi:hypothetical protein